MSDEMKLLTALCNALGFEIKVDRDFQERKVGVTEAMRYNTIPNNTGRRLLVSGPSCMNVIDENGFYTSVLSEPIVSYTLIKK